MPRKPKPPAVPPVIDPLVVTQLIEGVLRQSLTPPTPLPEPPLG